MKILKDTPFEFGFIPWQIRPPVWSLVVVVKGTYTAVDGGVCRDATGQRPVNGYVHWDDDPALSLRFDTDFAVFKPRAECFLAGHAHAPNQTAAPAVEVAFKVGTVYKSIVVMGDRTWNQPTPAPFLSMPLRWERSFGGASYASNPLGIGLDGVDTPQGRLHPLPNLENPQELITDSSDRPAPWGFFPIQMQWPPRSGHVGTYDDRWVKTRWPWLPDDLDWRFYNAAPTDQQIEGYWRGDEEVAWQHLHPERRRIRSKLPGEAARCFAVLKRGDEMEFREVVLRLDTITVDGDEDAVLCAWRGALEIADEKASDVEWLFFVREPLDARSSLAQCQAWFERKRIERESEDADLEAEVVPLEPDAAEAFEIPDLPDGITNEGLQLLAKLRGEADRLRPTLLADAEMLDVVHDLTRDELTGAAPEEALPTVPELKARAKTDGIELPTELAGLPDEVVPEAPPADLAELDTAEDPPPPSRADLLLLRAHEEPFTGLDLTGADLSSVDFSGVDFTGSVLARVNFRASVLDGCIFDDAVLDGADLTDASLLKASLKGADLTGVSADGANFTGAKLEAAIGGGARWTGARFCGASLKDAELTDGEFARADFEGADLSGADLSHSRCDEARFVRAVMKDTWFEAVHAHKAVFDDADLTGLRAAERSDFTDASFARVLAQGSKWDRAILVRADLHEAQLDQADFAGAALVRANLTRCSLRGATFQDAIAVAALMIRVDAFEANFEGADLSHADLRSANLFGAQLWRANTDGTVLDFAELGRTHLARDGE